MRGKIDWLLNKKTRIGETGSLRSKSVALFILASSAFFVAQLGLFCCGKVKEEYRSFKPKTIVKVVKEVVKEEVIKEVTPPRWFTFYGIDLPTYEVAIGTTCAVIAVIILKFLI